MKKLSKRQFVVLVLLILLVLGGVAWYFFNDKPAHRAMYSPSYTPDGFNMLLPAAADTYGETFRIEYQNSQKQSFYFFQQPIETPQSACSTARKRDNVSEFKSVDIDGSREACKYTITTSNNESHDVYAWEEYDLLFGFVVSGGIVSEDEVLNLAESIKLGVVDVEYGE